MYDNGILRYKQRDHMEHISLQTIHEKLTKGVSSSREDDILDILRMVSLVVQTTSRADICGILPVNPITNHFTLPEVLTSDQFTLSPEFSLPSTIATRALQEKLVIIDDWEREAEWQCYIPEQATICRTVAITLREN